MKFFVAEPRLRRPALSNNGKHFAGVDWLAFPGEDALDGAALGRADFVLHLHGFDNQKALAGFDVVSCFDEKTDDFTRHRRDDLLAAFGFDVAVAAGTPSAGSQGLRGGLLAGGREVSFSRQRRPPA